MVTSRDERAVPLVPRMEQGGYTADAVATRRAWVEERTGCRLDHLGRFTIDPESLRGNVENPIGAVQVPVGLAGPLAVRGEHAEGTFYVPIATTEGALVRSFERGMVALTRAGGATVRIWEDENRISPIFVFPGVAEARDFALRLPDWEAEVRAAAEATTRHGRLLRIEPHPVGRRVIVDFVFATGDAHGMNMIARATDAACRRLAELLEAEGRALDRRLLFSGREGEKRTSGSLLSGGKGKRVTAGAHLPRRVVRAVLGTTPEALAALFHDVALGHAQAGGLGINGHAANGVTALFLATGQDVANVANSSLAITEMELADDGGLHASVTLPSLVVATVGGGTGLPTFAECLDLLGCRGAGKAKKLAEIVAATVLAGELSFGASLAAAESVNAHETYGRNRPHRPDRPDGPDEEAE